MWLFHKKFVLWSGVVGLVLCGTVAGLFVFFRGHGDLSAAERERPRQENESSSDRVRVSVQTVHPKRDPWLIISVREPAKVEAFNQAELKARVAGPVSAIHKDLHNKVREGEVLIEIDAPDLVQDLTMREAAIQRRQSEVRLAISKAKIAEAQAEVAEGDIDLKQAQVKRAVATRDYRLLRYQRFQRLSKALTKAVDESVVDEEKRDYEAAEADCDVAAAGVKNAKLAWKQAKENSQAAYADIELKKSFVEEARRERDKAQAMLDLARIRAPFDGVVIERSVDPGSFVQNAATGHSDSLMTVARSDIMTVSMKVPDNFAPYVDINTEAALQLDELPGIVIHGRVTRYSPSIQEKDRTMLVEVDLYNGSRKEYERFITRQMGTLVTSVGHLNLFDALTARATARALWMRNRKGSDDPLPLFPNIKGLNDGNTEHRLLPGMYGSMKLMLQRFQNTYLLPSSAVFSRGGKRFIAQVEDGKVHITPVKVQVDDGTLVKVALICTKADETGEEQIFCDLTGAEEIVLAGQGELEDGQAVRTTLNSW
ncbi:MAG: efflux RND transporter periplasmic adaptor subunit [Gemmataceae bacterium]